MLIADDDDSGVTANSCHIQIVINHNASIVVLGERRLCWLGYVLQMDHQ